MTDATFFFSSSKGSTPEASGVTGNITVPEIAHDTNEDEYVVSHQNALSEVPTVVGCL